MLDRIEINATCQAAEQRILNEWGSLLDAQATDEGRPLFRRWPPGADEIGYLDDRIDRDDAREAPQLGQYPHLMAERFRLSAPFQSANQRRFS